MKEWQTILNTLGPSEEQGEDLFVHDRPAGRTYQASLSAQEDLLELRPWDADAEDLFEWYARIRGPKGGSYVGESALRHGLYFAL